MILNYFILKNIYGKHESRTIEAAQSLYVIWHATVNRNIFLVFQIVALFL